MKIDIAGCLILLRQPVQRGADAHGMSDLVWFTMNFSGIFYENAAPDGCDPRLWHRLECAAFRIYKLHSEMFLVKDPDERDRRWASIHRAVRVCERVLPQLDSTDRLVAESRAWFARIMGELAKLDVAATHRS